MVVNKIYVLKDIKNIRHVLPSNSEATMISSKKKCNMLLSSGHTVSSLRKGHKKGRKKLDEDRSTKSHL